MKNGDKLTRAAIAAGAALATALPASADGAGAADPAYTPSEVIENAPFSEAVKVGDLLFLSGQIGTDGSDRLVPGGIVPEARQTMENIKRAVEKNGSSMDRIVKCTVFLADIGEWRAFNEVYVSFFDKDRLPARSALGASGLALGARTEVECIAALNR